MITLIQLTEKKEKSSEIRDVVLVVLFWWLIEIYIVHFISIEIPDIAQINDQLYTFSNFFNQEPIYNLTLEIYASFQMCVCYLLLLLLEIIYQIGCWDIFVEWIFFKIPRFVASFPFWNKQWQWTLEQQEFVDVICILSFHSEI